MIAWIDAVAAKNAPEIFGLSLVERHLHGLRGVKPAPWRIVIDLPVGTAEPKLGDQRLYRLPLEWRRSGESYSLRLSEMLGSAGSESLLVLDAGTLADPRLPAALASRSVSTAVLSREAQDGAAILLLVSERQSDLEAMTAGADGTAALAKRLVESGRIAAL